MMPYSQPGKALCFGRFLRAVFYQPQISHHTKSRIYNATVSSIMLYSSDTLLVAQIHLRKVNAIQTRHLCRIKGFEWDDKIRNSKILKTFKLADLSAQVEACSLRWYGHLLCLPLSIPAKIILDFNPSENGWKHPEGRSCNRWADVINQRPLSDNIISNEAPSVALDNATWIRLTALSTSSLHWRPCCVRALSK